MEDLSSTSVEWEDFERTFRDVVTEETDVFGFGPPFGLDDISPLPLRW